MQVTRMLADWRKRHFLLVDAMLATAIVVVAVALAHASVPDKDLIRLLYGTRTTLYGAASAGCAALLGFVITTTTITEAVMQDAQWKIFRKSSAYSELQDMYFSAIRWLGLSTLVYLTFLIADTDAHPLLLCEALSAWLAFVVAARVWRTISALELLLRMNTHKAKLIVE